MTERHTSLKHYFDATLAERLAGLLKPHVPDFPTARFIASVAEQTATLELKARVAVIPHVHRLVSEGTRPRLPWARRIGPLAGDPANNFALLKPLWNDPSPYVRKSVANHVHDLTKQHKDATLDWLYCQHKQGQHSAWMLRHGLRSLLQAGDARALDMLRLAANVQKWGESER